MKKFHLLLLTVLSIAIGLSFSAFGQKGTVKQININDKGGLYNSAGTKLGYIDKNDIVRDNAGKELYFIAKDGSVVTAGGKKLGLAKKNGSYYNINGENVLITKDIDKEHCAILDPKGHNFGTAHKNYKLHACAAHCYWLAKEQEKTAPKH